MSVFECVERQVPNSLIYIVSSQASAFVCSCSQIGSSGSFNLLEIYSHQASCYIYKGARVGGEKELIAMQRERLPLRLPDGSLFLFHITKNHLQLTHANTQYSNQQRANSFCAMRCKRITHSSARSKLNPHLNKLK